MNSQGNFFDMPRAAKSMQKNTNILKGTDIRVSKAHLLGFVEIKISNAKLENWESIKAFKRWETFKDLKLILLQKQN